MKYRVKYKCYHYNTGMGDNCYYIAYTDFDVLEDAEKFQVKIREQYETGNKWQCDQISYNEYMKWRETFDLIEIEDGFIDSPDSVIVKFFPSREEVL